MQGPFLADYGVTKTVQFVLYLADGSALQPSATIATGDVKRVIDGAAIGNTTNLPTNEGGGIYSLVLTAAECTGDAITVILDDATATETFLGTALHIVTTGNVNATAGFDLASVTPAVGNAATLTGAVNLNLNSIGAAQIAAGAIEADAFAANSITASAIASGAIAGEAVSSVTGAVGSVTGAVGSVTARVTANVDQVDGVALDTHTAGQVPADLRSYSGSTTGITALGEYYGVVRRVTIAATNLSTTGADTDLSETVTDALVDRPFYFVTGTMTGMNGVIRSSMVGAPGFLSWNDQGATPSAGDILVIF